MNRSTRRELAALSRTAVADLDRLQDAVVTAMAAENDLSALASVAKSFEDARAFLAFWQNPEKEAESKEDAAS